MKKSLLKNRIEVNERKNKKQEKHCVSYPGKAKRKYCSNLNIKDISDNKTVLKTVKPFLSEKIMSTIKITLIEETTLFQMILNIPSFEYSLF